MGVVISSTASLSVFSLVTGIIGLVSFAFTVSTFLKVVWTNLETIGEAPHEVHAYLTNLRQELVEERTSLKSMRKASREIRKRHAQRRHEDRASNMDVGIISEVTLKTMSDTIKRLIRSFAELERPFLEPDEMGISEVLHPRQAQRRRKDDSRRRSVRRDESDSPYYSHEAYASAPEKRRRSHTKREPSQDPRSRNSPNDPYYESDVDDGDQFWAQRTRYAQYSLIKRLRWLWCKPRAEKLFAVLERFQVRRIAQQMASISRANHEYGLATLDAGDATRRIEDRLSRFVGARRIDE